MLILVVLTALLPALVLLVLTADVFRYARRRIPFALTRLVLFGWTYLVIELTALISLLGVGVATGFGRWRRPFLGRTFALQTWWAHRLFAAVRFLFGARIETEGEEAITPGPILLFVRHASIADVLLPNVVVTGRHGIRLRYVLKRELLVDPAIDIAGNRIPNYFVDRGSGDTAVEIERVASLTDDLEADEGVAIYPEGTRFSPEKRARALERLRRSRPDLAERAERLRATLPPRLGGPLALLGSHTPADVVFMAHVGFDGLAEVRDLLDGGLVGTTIRIAFWRVSHAEIPRDRAGRAAWLFDQWERVDAWIADHRGVR